MNIRKVRQEDNPFLGEIICQVFEEYDAPKQGSVYSDEATFHLFETFQNPQSELWVAQEGETILGSCGISPTDGLPEGIAELVKFYLTPGARGKGLGRLLMQRSIESAKQLGYRSLYLESFPQFENAIGMYEKLGFERIDHPLGNSGHTACTVWMIKHLD